eukprot:scaffold133_cov257-Pinguiococcus_pyrenoidosus.AAC.19
MRIPWAEGGRSLAPPCGTDKEDLSRIVEALRIGASDVMYDLGCGDGRVCLACAKAGAKRCIGIEIEEVLLDRFRQAIARGQKAGELQHGQVLAKSEDLRLCDFSDATVIYVFLLPAALEVIEPQLRAAVAQGTRLVCNTWGPRDWRPVETLQLNELGTLTLLLYSQSSIKPDSTGEDRTQGSGARAAIEDGESSL